MTYVAVIDEMLISACSAGLSKCRITTSNWSVHWASSSFFDGKGRIYFEIVRSIDVLNVDGLLYPNACDELMDKPSFSGLLNGMKN